MVRAVETDTFFREGFKGLVILRIRMEDHDTAVEAIWPAYIWSRSERYVQREQFVRCLEGHDIAVQVNDSLELRLTP